MKKLNMLAAAAALALPLSVQADIIGGTIEASYWHAGFGGDVKNNATVSLEDQLKLENAGGIELAASFEHPIPILPNIKIKQLKLDETQTSTASFAFEGENFSASTETQLDLSHRDFILYYEILDNWVVVDVGLAAKFFDGELRIKDADSISTTKIDETIPMGYLKASFEMPFTGMSVGAELNTISFDGDSLTDAKIALRQDISLAFIELGYRQFTIEIDDVSGTDVDADLSGVYLSTGLDF